MSHEVSSAIESEARDTAAAATPAPATAPSCRLLIVGAHPQRAARIRRLFAEAGPQVVCDEAKHPGDAPRRLQGGRYDLVLLDLDDEATTLRACSRLLETAPDVPVVVLSREPSAERARQVVALGAEDVIAHDELNTGRLGRALACALERHRRVVALRELSLTDPLTGLYNRRGFAVLAEAHRRVLRRTRGQSLLLFADVDQLKRINDRNGHAAGDRAIVSSGIVLAGALRASDVVARYGGDEFVALAHDAAHVSAEMLVRRIGDGLARLNAEGTLPFPLSLSVGVSTFGPTGGIAASISRADREMQLEKRRRREAAEAARP